MVGADRRDAAPRGGASTPSFSLRARLTLAVLVPFAVLGALLLGGASRGARLYFEEVHYKLNRDVAAHVAKSLKPFAVGADPGGARESPALDTKALQGLFMDVMRINPSLEVYLLDAGGKILAFDAPAGRVRRERVRLAPLRAALTAPDAQTAGRASATPRGDDPRSVDGTKPFSVAELRVDEKLQGYLYVILGGEQHEALAASWRESAMLRWGGVLALAGLAAAALGAALGIAWIVRPLRRLRDAMASFRLDSAQGGPSEALSDSLVPLRAIDVRRRDEVGDLARTFEGMEARLAQQLEQLQRNDQRRREFVANISHDLRTPTGAIQGYLEALTVRWNTFEPQERERFLGSALRQAERLGKLVDQLFELTRLEAREFAPHKEAIYLPELVQDIVAKFRRSAEDKGVVLRASIATDVPPVVADIGLLERALDNLIDNAIRYTPPRGEVEVRLRQVAGGIAVRVGDSGPGIPSEVLPHVFERFFRVERANDQVSGTGLGLAITKRIVDLHGATIEVDSRLDEGTTFSFVLPAVEGDQGACGSNEAAILEEHTEVISP